MGPYSVKMVSDLLGISPHTLRAWERRYAAIAPGRSDTGRRRYNSDEVERLRLLVSLTQMGHSIGDIAQLPKGKLESLAKHPKLPPAGEENDLAPRVERLVQALCSFRLSELSQELEWARVSLSCRDFVLKIISPLMGEVGMLVAENGLSIAQEHALSAIIRDQIGQILQLLQNHRPNIGGKPLRRVILTTPEGDLHEFGILLAAVLCAHHGVSAHYLGPNLPAEALAEAVTALHGDLVLLGHAPVPREERKRSFEDYLQGLDSSLPRKVEIWIGGQGDWPKRLSLKEGRVVKRLQSLNELDGLLKKMGRAA